MLLWEHWVSPSKRVQLIWGCELHDPDVWICCYTPGYGTKKEVFDCSQSQIPLSCPCCHARGSSSAGTCVLGCEAVTFRQVFQSVLAWYKSDQINQNKQYSKVPLALVVLWLRLELPTRNRGFESHHWPVSGHFSLLTCLTPMPWSSLSSTPSNEEMFHRILRRGCNAISPRPGDLAQSASGYSRPLLATIIVVNPKG